MAQRRWKYFCAFCLITFMGSVIFLSDYYYALVTEFQRQLQNDSFYFVNPGIDSFYKKILKYTTGSDETHKAIPKFEMLHGFMVNNEFTLNKDENINLGVGGYTDRTFPVQDLNTADVNCHLIFEGNDEEINKAVNRSKTESLIADTMDYVNFTKNCSSFITKRGYVMSSLTTLEKQFPIAYSILMYKDVEQVERLIRAIYRPQNIYCIHVDKKSRNATFKAIESISSCFPNILMAPKRVTVWWGKYSVLEPELICMEELLKRNKRWKYFINLTGQEFPLRTNYELVKVLIAYDGANDISGTVKRANKERWSKLPPPPHNVTATKGSVHIAANREFVDFAVHNQKAKDLLEWIKYGSIPDEGFFATLNHNPSSFHIKGSYLEWLASRGSSEEFEQLDNHELDTMLVKFYAEVRNYDGQQYSKSTFTGIRASINRYLRAPPYSRNICMTHDDFHRSNQVFVAILTKLKRDGLDRTKHYLPIAEADLNKLRQSDVFCLTQPKSLQRKVWFDIALAFARRGREKLQNLKKDAFAFKQDDTGLEYAEMTYNEATKNQPGVKSDTNQDSKTRMYANKSPACPLSSLKLYINKLNPGCEVFFQQARNKVSSDDEFWYTSRPVGPRTLGVMMKVILNEAHLSQVYINHSVRAATITLLSHAGVDTRSIMRISQHKNEGSVKSYNRDSSDAQKRQHSAILQGNSTAETNENTVPLSAVEAPVVSSPPTYSNGHLKSRALPTSTAKICISELHGAFSC